MSHTLEECAYTSVEYFDECEICGDLTACTCLNSIVSAWQVEPTGLDGWMSYRYQYQANNSLVARFGYAETRREAMDSIVCGVKCQEVA
jgi:hypothetical protein